MTPSNIATTRQMRGGRNLGMILSFANIAGKAPRLSDYAANFINRWHEFEIPINHDGLGSSFVLSSNFFLKTSRHILLLFLTPAICQSETKQIFTASRSRQHHGYAELLRIRHRGFCTANRPRWVETPKFSCFE